MDTLTSLIFENAEYAHWIIFSALMLAGFNVPISEDLMVILSASLAATIVPHNFYKLFIALFLGCYISDWVCYWIGRLYGRKLWRIRWFSKTFDPKRIEKVETYYQRYGFWTLLVGRFIPFGVRNCLFLTAGLGKMHFGKFLISDGIACILSNTILFSLTYAIGKNHETILSNLKIFNIFLFGAFLVAVIALFWYKRRKKNMAL